MRKYSIHRAPGTFLTFDQRELLARDWNRLVKYGPMPTLRTFAGNHGVPYETWRREFNRGRMGETVPDLRRPGRWIYAEYDPGKAQDEINANAANKGAPMRVTNVLVERFAYYVKTMRLSPTDTVFHLREDFRDAWIPCASTWYKHIRCGDLPVHYGETPYNPHRKHRKGPKPHPAKTVPGRLQLADRPREADERSEPGHWEMDTVVSCLNGRGGLLVLIDRHTREYRIEPLNEISQHAVVCALKRLMGKHRLGTVKSITTDNGCEFLDPVAIQKVLRCNVYYTRAYASYEKGSVENCNRIVRRWYPKGTDFSRYAHADFRRLEQTINGIHRKVLGWKTATEFAAAYNAVA